MSQVSECKKPHFIFYSDSELKKLGQQTFCAVCERWQFKKQKCKLFVKGEQF